MYEQLSEVSLKSGEKVELGVVVGPDPDWVDRIAMELLGHKGEPWRWGNRKVLLELLEMEAYFYILHRNGIPFANVMTIEFEGKGILGHVFTKPADRRQGAASRIFEGLMDHFTDRGGKALVLGTGFDSPPYHIYRSFGFVGIEDKSGVMEYYSDSKLAFDSTHFASGPTEVHRLTSSHYPVAPFLFAGDYQGVVRSVPMSIIGRGSSEGPLLPFLKNELDRTQEDREPKTSVLLQTSSRAVVGLATWDWDPIWPHTCVVDVFCHPEFWSHGKETLGYLGLPDADRYVAYCDVGFVPKESCLERSGYLRRGVYNQRIRNRINGDLEDVGIWEKV